MNSKESVLDAVNTKLLRLLQKDPRASISELARHVKMSNPAVKERILRLEERGIIAGYRLDLGAKELGYELLAFVRIRPLPGHLAKIADLAGAIPEITECHRITGEDCFILKVYLENVSSLDRILDRFLVHGQTTTSIVQSSPVALRSIPLPIAD